MAGETGPTELSFSWALLMASFFAVCYYNTIEIFVLIFSTFKQWRGRYFWSMVAAALGIPLHATAFLLRYFGLAPNLAMSAFTIVGWVLMVTGQSVVLWSRLHLVVYNQTIIRLVLAMIVTNGCLIHIPESVIFLYVNTSGSAGYLRAFLIYERLEIVVFSLQESIISGLFLWEGYRSFWPVLALRRSEGRRFLAQLIVLFLVNVLLDSVLIALEYSGRFQLQTSIKPFVYSVKLKVEFIILNKLVHFTRTAPINPLSSPTLRNTMSGTQTQMESQPVGSRRESLMEGTITPREA